MKNLRFWVLALALVALPCRAAQLIQDATLSGNTTVSGNITFSGTPITWASVSKTGSTLADFTTRSAGDLSSGTLLAARMPALTGDITTSAGAVATTLATVNSNVGTFGSSSAVAVITVNGKGLITAASNATISGLPTQTGNSGKLLTTDGTSASWTATPALGAATGTSLSLSGTTASTSTTTGTLINAGGFGNAGAAYIGGIINVASSSTSTIGGRLNIGGNGDQFSGSGNSGWFDIINGQTTGTRIRNASNTANGPLTCSDITLDKTITAAGTTGAQTINKASGSVNLAAAATTLVVTNSLVTTSSVILCTVGTNDTTCKSVAVVAGSGSFTIYANAAPTAETRVYFRVTN